MLSALLPSCLLTYLITYFTLSVRLYHGEGGGGVGERGCREKVKPSISRKSERYNKGDGVYPQTVLDAPQEILSCFVYGSVFDSFNNLFW